MVLSSSPKVVKTKPNNNPSTNDDTLKATMEIDWSARLSPATCHQYMEAITPTIHHASGGTTAARQLAVHLEVQPPQLLRPPGCHGRRVHRADVRVSHQCQRLQPFHRSHRSEERRVEKEG